ncbi:hypothetical protein BYT27DRAFT_7076595, partial [Phlegmacium glaucopus]
MAAKGSAGPYHDDPKRIQEVILYCASRLRAASIATVNAPTPRRAWQERLLVVELQLALSYIGMAVAIGQSCDVPIILQTLACDLYQRSPDYITLLFDRDFLLALDAGSDLDDLAAVAESYHLAWWTYGNPPSEDVVLSYSSMHDALEHHHAVTGIKGILPVKVNKAKYTWSRHLSDPKGFSLNCDRCRLYRGVSLGVLDNLQDLRHQVHGLEVASEYRVDQAGRRAAGFFQLYDTVLLKECEDTQSTLAKGKAKVSKSRQANQVREVAAADLARLQDLPSLKWTWGPDLTEEDIHQLGKPTLPTAPPQHSGYEFSLPWGRCGKASESPAS